jgi:hypothetical protein
MSKGFKWALGVIGGFIVLVVIGALIPTAPNVQSDANAVSTQADSPSSSTVATPAAQPASQTWTSVASWSGNGIKETESFVTSSREWRVQWQARNEPFAGAGILQIMVYDGSGTLVTLAANKQGTGSDVSYVRSTPGRHYLMINSGNVDWDVTVEEQR